MKILATVTWVRTTEIDVDESQLNNNEYINQIQAKILEIAIDELNIKCGYVTDVKPTPENDGEEWNSDFENLVE